MKECPYCAEEIQDEAIFCRYCSHDLTSANEPIDKKENKIKGVVRLYFILLIIAVIGTFLASKNLNTDLTIGLVYSSVYGLSTLGLYMRQKWGYFLAYFASIPFFLSIFLIPIGLYITKNLSNPDIKLEFGFKIKETSEKNNSRNKLGNIIIIVIIFCFFAFIVLSNLPNGFGGNIFNSSGGTKDSVINPNQPTVTKNNENRILTPIAKPINTLSVNSDTYRQSYITKYETKISQCIDELTEIERRIKSINNDIFSASTDKYFKYYTLINLDLIRSICGTLGDMKPPDDFIEYNSFLILASDEFKRYSDKFIVGMDKKDQSIVDEANNHLENGYIYLGKAKNIEPFK